MIPCDLSKWHLHKVLTLFLQFGKRHLPNFITIYFGKWHLQKWEVRICFRKSLHVAQVAFRISSVFRKTVGQIFRQQCYNASSPSQLFLLPNDVSPYFPIECQQLRIDTKRSLVLCLLYECNDFLAPCVIALWQIGGF